MTTDPKVQAQQDALRHLTQRQLDAAPKTLARGIDVSKWQGVIQWGKLLAQGITVAGIKATEGGFADSRFSDNWQGAAAAGIKRSAYLFYRPEEDPIKQADLFCKVVGPLKEWGALRPTIDLEKATPEQPPADDNRKLGALINLLHERYGKAPIIYTSGRYIGQEHITLGGDKNGAEGCPLWVVRYQTAPADWYSAAPKEMPAQWKDWAIWQLGYCPGVAGISGDVDRDLFKVDPATLLL